MKAYITRHSNNAQGWARLSSGTTLAMLGAHSGDSIDLDFTGGVQNSADLTEGVYEITIDGGNARVLIGAGAVADNVKGQFWKDGRCDLRFVRTGQRISVIAAV